MQMLYYLLLVLAKGPVGAAAVLLGLSGPASFSACHQVPGTKGAPMCLVRGGTFTTCLGPARDKCEEATVAPFMLDRSHVTVAMFNECVKSGACKERHFYNRDKSDFCNLGRDDRLDHPANCLNIEAADEYCEWAGKRLPTAGEWLAAASDYGHRKYPWGNDPPDCTKAVYHGDQGRGCGKMYTVPSGSLAGAVSAFGPVDMAGNVMQWTSTIASTCTGTQEQPEAKPTPSPEDDEEAMRYIGGGSFADMPDLLRGDTVSVDEGESKSIGLGVRCAR